MRLTDTLLCLAWSATLPLLAANSYPPPTTDQSRPMLGVEMTPVPLTVQEREGLTPNQGVLVQSVFGNTAAQNMGLQSGDVILGINGAPIGSMTDLRNEVSLNQVGDPVEVTVQRQGQQITSTGQFQPWPSNIPYEPIDPAMEQRFRDWQERRLDRSRDELDDLRRQVSDLQKQLNPDQATANGASAQAGADAAGQLAWRFRYGYHSPTTDATPVAAAAPVDAQAADPIEYGVKLPWRFDWRMSSDPRAAQRREGM